MSRRTFIVPGLIALMLMVTSVVNLVVAGQGITRRTEMVDRVPLEIFLPTQPPTATITLPTVLVVHGFSGNRQLMYGFGNTLARNGYAAALIDVAGHGDSTDRLPDGFADAQAAKLDANIDTALVWLRQQPFVDDTRVALLGHSMGASSVARYASTHPEVPVTIALSLGNFGTRLPNDPANPRNLLIMVGAAEFASFVQGSTAGLMAGYPDGIAGQTYGDFAQGTARRLFIVPGVEHISILFSHAAYREVVQWLDAAFAVARPAPASESVPILVDARIGWVLLLYLAAIIGFWPLMKLLFGRSPQTLAQAHLTGAGGVNVWRVIVMSVVAAGLPVLLLRVNVLPYRLVPLTVGNYVGAFFLIYGLIVGVYVWLKLRETRTEATRSLNQAYTLLFPTIAISAYALVTLAVPGHLAWNNFALIGDRTWIAVILFVGCLTFFLADEVSVARASRRARLGLYALTKLIVILALTLAVFAFGAPGFLLLLLPVMVVLFIWHGVYSHWLFGQTHSPWPGAVLNAVVFAWTIAATFALVQY